MKKTLISGCTWGRRSFLQMAVGITAGLASTISLASTGYAAPKQQFETPPVLSAVKLLPPQLLKGPYHTVNDRITSDGYFNNYRIESTFGVFEVEGQQLLETRVGELVALAELDKLTSTSVFGDAAYKAGKGLVLAPVNVVKKTAKIVSDPKKMGDTLSAIPEGAEKLFSWAYRQGKGAVNAVGGAFSSDDSKDEKKKEGESSSVSISGTLDQGAKFGLDYIGYNKNQREWFRKLKINPYTTNETLRGEVVRVATIETTVGTAFKFVPGLGLLGELGTFNRWYERAEKLSLYEDPEEIRKKNKKGLQALGVPDELVTAFLDNKAYTPWTRRFITASLTTIGPKVPGHSDFIRAACQATNEPSALYFVSVAESLENLSSIMRIKKIVSSLHLPAAVTQEGTLYVPLSVDYLFWTEAVAGIFKDFKGRVMKEASFSSADIVVRGHVSPLARKMLESMGARVSEGHL